MNRQLVLATLSFAVCFCAWGLIGAFAPSFREEFGLSATQTSLLVSTPVILGSLARIPAGVLSDRYGGRLVLALILLIAALACSLIPAVNSFQALLAAAFLLGVGGSSFAAGVSYVSRWFPLAAQGTALGIFGMGNMGQSVAIYAGPMFAAAYGRAAVFFAMSGVLVLTTAVFWMVGKDAPLASPSGGFGELLTLAGDRVVWALSAFYFVTFGGLIAFSVYLPILLSDKFGVTEAQAGVQVALFVVVANILRPVGGFLADRMGGGKVLAIVFGGLIPGALLMGWPVSTPFTIGAIACSALLGLGNGAVFKLVPQFFPGRTGAVTGLVGAIGALGGFFPPLLLGHLRDSKDAVWPGFVLLAATCAAMAVVNRRMFRAA
jgi:NNP family nitrate/nitrite transporter-like MFS transporter